MPTPWTRPDYRPQLEFATTAHAQAGLRVGGTLVHLTTKGEVQAAYYLEARNLAKLGYQVGLFYQVPLNKRLSLVPEMQFSRERVHLAARDNNFAVLEY